MSATIKAQNMSKVSDFLSNSKVLEEAESKVNGKLTVIKDVVWGIQIKGGGLTQSGGIAKKIWQSTLKSIRTTKVKNCLILGLGGGSIAKLIHKYWPEATVTGVDVDPVIVSLGEKYFNLDPKKVDINIEDASKFIQKNNKYDLICIDTYVKDQFPKHLESQKFLNSVNKSLKSPGGVAVFNRFYQGDRRKKAIEFEKKLLKVFSRVDRFFPEANVMFLCSNRSLFTEDNKG